MGRTFPAALALAGLLAACAGGGPEVNLAAEAAAIQELNRQWLEAVAAKDTVAIATFYAPDAFFMVPNRPRVEGTQAIRTTWAEFLGQPGLELTFQTVKLEVAEAGDMAYDAGNYSLSAPGPDGEPIRDVGKFVVVWRKVLGEWKVAADIFNSDLPAEG